MYVSAIISNYKISLSLLTSVPIIIFVDDITKETLNASTVICNMDNNS